MKTTMTSLFSIPFFLAYLSALVSALDCKQTVVAGGRKFDLSKLDSVHSVYSIDKSKPPAVSIQLGMSTYAGLYQ